MQQLKKATAASMEDIGNEPLIYWESRMKEEEEWEWSDSKPGGGDDTKQNWSKWNSGSTWPPPWITHTSTLRGQMGKKVGAGRVGWLVEKESIVVPLPQAGRAGAAHKDAANPPRCGTVLCLHSLIASS